MSFIFRSMESKTTTVLIRKMEDSILQIKLCYDADKQRWVLRAFF
jgi:hypothetical protein